MSTYEPLPLSSVTAVPTNSTIPAGYIRSVYANPCDNNPRQNKQPAKPAKDRSAPFKKFFK